MTAPRLVIPNFGTIEDKMRRSLGLVGEVGTSFDPSVKPVVVADDCTRPGCSAFRGRRFGFGVAANLTVGGAATVGLKALVDVIITRVAVPTQGTNGVVVQLRYVPADVADPYAFTAAVPWIDLGRVSGDVAPVLATGTLQADSAIGSVVHAFVTGSTTGSEIEPLHLPPNAKLLVRFTGLVANAVFNFSGQVF